MWRYFKNLLESEIQKLRPEWTKKKKRRNKIKGDLIELRGKTHTHTHTQKKRSLQKTNRELQDAHERKDSNEHKIQATEKVLQKKTKRNKTR